jgi:photosystem II CP43 chlorophyll apoprotein
MDLKLWRIFPFFGYVWKDKNKMTSILGYHLSCWVVLGYNFKSYVLWWYLWHLNPGGGDVRIITQLQTSVLFFGYLLRSPFGGDGWICSVDNLEDIGGHIWSVLYVFSVVFGIYTTHGLGTSCFRLVCEAYLSYSLAAIAVMGFTACNFSWFNNTAYPSEFYGPTGPEALKLKHILSSWPTFRCKRCICSRSNRSR